MSTSILIRVHPSNIKLLSVHSERKDHKVRIFIDGDNNAPSHNNGIERLSQNDYISYFYNNNSAAYYNQDSKKEKLLALSKAKIDFRKVCSGKNAVDFEILISLFEYLTHNRNSVVILVSADKDYDVICKIMSKRFPSAVIRLVTSINEAYPYKLIETSDYNEAVHILNKCFGENATNRIVSQLEKMVLENRHKRAKKMLTDFFQLK